MGEKCFGEFVATAVLILLGDGVVANVLLKKSKAEGAGWMTIATGWAFAGGSRRIRGHRMRQSGCGAKPGGDFRRRDRDRRFFENDSVLHRPDARRNVRRAARMAALPASLA